RGPRLRGAGPSRREPELFLGTTAGSRVALLVQHPFEGGCERGGDLHGLAQVALPLGGLLGQDVAVHRLMTRHLATARNLETLRGPLVRLLLGQGWLLSETTFLDKNIQGREGPSRTSLPDPRRVRQRASWRCAADRR